MNDQILRNDVFYFFKFYRFLKLSSSDQCDQIGRNFAALEKFLNSLATFWGLNVEPTVGKKLLFGKVSML